MLESIVMKYPSIFGFYLDESSYYGHEPFLFLDKDAYESDPTLLDNISIEIVKLFKESNKRHNWGLEIAVINSFVLEPNLVSLNLLEIMNKNYKIAVINGYFTSKLCTKPLKLSLELFKYKLEPAREKVYQEINPELYFSHACNGGAEHEAISSPIEIDGGYCSFVLSLNFYDPIPGDDRYYINLNTSVRQWISAEVPLNYKNYKSGVSLFIGYFNRRSSSKLIRTKLNRTNRGDNSQFDYGIPTVHKDTLDNYGIEIRNVLDNTVKYIRNGQKQDQLFVGIPYSNANKSWWENHYHFKLTGNGVTLEEERNFYEKIGNALDGIKLIEGYTLAEKSKYSALKKEKTKKVLFSNMIIPDGLECLTVNVFTSEEKQMQEFRSIFLDVIEDKGGEVLFPLSGGNDCRVRFQNKSIGVKVNEIQVEAAHRLYEKSEEEKLKDVIKEISPYVKKYPNEMNLFFIPAYQSYKAYKEKDPIRIIRKAFLQLDSHVQFINYRIDDGSKDSAKIKNMDTETNKLHRFRNAFLDSMSKQGIVQGMKNFKVVGKMGTMVATNIVELGVLPRKIGKKEFLFMTKSVSGKVYIKAAGVSDWYVYSDVAKFFNKLTDVTTKTEKIDEVLIMGQLLSELKTIKMPIILYISANLRMQVEWLRNKNYTLENNPLIYKFKDLSIIRINNWSDIPSYFTRKIKEGEWVNSQESGVFQGSETIFFSLGERGDQIYGQLGKSRFDLEKEQDFKKKKVIELAILNNNPQLQNSDLANLAHQRRRANISYDSYTNFPQPLYWIEQIVEDYEKI